MNLGNAAPASPFDDGPQRPGLVPALVVALAAILSGIVVWYPTQSAALTGGFVAAGLMAAAALYVLQPRRSGESVATVEASDWSLVRSVADNDRRGLAITDRTGRLVCANDRYCDWFGGAVTPPGLPVDAPTAALLAEAGRIAWRDGEAAVAAFTCGTREMTGTVERVGRIGDHLLWRWDQHVASDPVANAIALMGGNAGRALGEAGVMAVVVTASGTIRTANAAFRLRAGGALDAAVEGHDFAAALKVDTQGLIRFVNEREGATPLRIIEVPFNADVPTSPLMLLLVDEDGGAAERGIALDYVENLLASLPFGMAMVKPRRPFPVHEQRFPARHRRAGRTIAQIPQRPCRQRGYGRHRRSDPAPRRGSGDQRRHQRASARARR